MPLIFELFCGPGGSGRGYADAGFDLIGVDIDHQPSYPHEFYQADALRVLKSFIDTGAWNGIKLDDIDAFHGSPPCQRFSSLTSSRLKEKGLEPEDVHPNLIPPTRGAFQKLGKPYVIENVEGAPLNPTVTLCGTMWEKKVRWHRLFETSFPVSAPAPCDHTYPIYNPFARKNHAQMMKDFPGIAPETVHAMERGINPSWMTYKERRQAVPPYYSEWIGRALMGKL
jgi:DNA (cytosine-5)-methyltransferase 1